MRTYARAQFELDTKPEKSEVTMREHYRRILLYNPADSAIENLLTGPSLPYVVAHVWHWWVELHNGRNTGGMGGISTLSWEAIGQYMQLRDHDPLQEEITLLRAVEQEYMEFCAEQMKRSTPPPTDT